MPRNSKFTGFLAIILFFITIGSMVYGTSSLIQINQEYQAKQEECDNLLIVYREAIEMNNLLIETIYDLYTLDNYIYESIELGTMNVSEAKILLYERFWEVDTVKENLLKSWVNIIDIFLIFKNLTLIYWYPTFNVLDLNGINIPLNNSFYFYYDQLIPTFTNLSLTLKGFSDYRGIFLLQMNLGPIGEKLAQSTKELNILEQKVDNLTSAMVTFFLTISILNGVIDFGERKLFWMILILIGSCFILYLATASLLFG